MSLCMADQTPPQADEDPGELEQSDQNREEQQEGAVPGHDEDRPVDPAPEDESS